MFLWLSIWNYEITRRFWYILWSYQKSYILLGIYGLAFHINNIYWLYDVRIIYVYLCRNVMGINNNL